MSDLSLTYTAAEGTLLEGDSRPHHGIAKAAGFRWSRNLGAWFLPNSRDRVPSPALVARLVDGFAAVGLVVAVEIDDASRPVAEREADRIERLEARHEALAAKSGRLSATAAAQFAKVDQLAGAMNGQPILVGHHSERRHRSDIAKMNSAGFNGLAAYREAEETQRRAKAGAANLGRRESGPVTVRRIDRLEVEQRDVARKLAGKACTLSGRKLKPDHTVGERTCPLCGEQVTYGAENVVPEHFPDYGRPASGEWAERLNARHAEIADEVAYWRAHLVEIGYEVPSADEFHKGQRVRFRHGVGVVVRVNPKTVTVRCGASGYELKYGREELTPIPDDE